jgi:hypothetical protein
MRHVYENVPGIGDLVISRHAQIELATDNIKQEDIDRILFEEYEDVPDGIGVMWRQRCGVRLVIVLKPQPFRGAALVVTGYRIQGQKRVRA